MSPFGCSGWPDGCGGWIEVEAVASGPRSPTAALWVVMKLRLAKEAFGNFIFSVSLVVLLWRFREFCRGHVDLQF